MEGSPRLDRPRRGERHTRSSSGPFSAGSSGTAGSLHRGRAHWQPRWPGHRSSSTRTPPIWTTTRSRKERTKVLPSPLPDISGATAIEESSQDRWRTLRGRGLDPANSHAGSFAASEGWRSRAVQGRQREGPAVAATSIGRIPPGSAKPQTNPLTDPCFSPTTQIPAR